MSDGGFLDDAVTGTRARAALAELNRVRDTVRIRSRWYAGYLLVLGAGTTVYYLGVELAAATTAGRLAMSAGWVVFMSALVVWGQRQPVLWRGLRRTRHALMTLYFVLIGATVLVSATVLADTPGRWLLGLIPAVPCVVGASLVLRP